MKPSSKVPQAKVAPKGGRHGRYYQQLSGFVLPIHGAFRDSLTLPLERRLLMTASAWHLRTAQKIVLALTAIVGTLDLASAEPVNNSGLTPQECYSKDSGCTQFCGKVTGPLRYECFSICDRMLDHCLDTG